MSPQTEAKLHIDGIIYHHFPIFQPDDRLTIGYPPIKLATIQCPQCCDIHEYEICPLCGNWIEMGFGLMFGGYGGYKFCSEDDCPWYWKHLLPNNEG